VEGEKIENMGGPGVHKRLIKEKIIEEVQEGSKNIFVQERGIQVPKKLYIMMVQGGGNW